jgi:hypothetical protein
VSDNNFLMGTIHGTNANKVATPNVNKAVEIQDGNDDVSVLTAKTTGDTQSEVVVGSQIASSSNPISGPTANSTQPGATSRELEDPSSIGQASGIVGGPNDKLPLRISPLHPREGGLIKHKADCQVGGQLQGAEGVTNVCQDTNGRKQPVGSVNFLLHV